MTPYVLFFDEVDASRVPVVGGKGAHLGQLSCWGFPVPHGFCVTAAAMDALMGRERLGEIIAHLASGLRPSPLEILEEHTARIREMIEQAPIPPAVEAEIRNAWDRLRSRAGSEPLVAVRSSVATRDGSRSSFPGQMDTYHNLAGIESVLEGIRRCWASAWSARAAMTRMKLGLGPHDVIVAPLVQRMVQPDVAGVLFTADPVTGDAGQVVVEAAIGLGEAVVSGTVTPDQYVVQKESLRTVRHSKGKQTFRIALDAEKGSGTRRVALAGSKRAGGTLSSGQLEALVRSAIRIESLYGGQPQDVEWAFSEGSLHILQTRRISGLPAPGEGGGSRSVLADNWEDSVLDTPNPDPSHTYTSANISEVLPGVLTPLTASGLKPLDYGFWKTNHDLGLYRDPFPEDDRELVFLGLFYGRPHLNLTRFRRIASQFPGGSAAEFDRPFPGSEGLEEDAAPFRFTPQSLWFLLRLLRQAHSMWRRVPLDLRRCAEAVETEYRSFRQMDLKTLPLETLLSMLERDREDALEVMVLHIKNSVMAVAFYECLRVLCARWLDDASGATAARLVTGLTTLESARPNREIHRLYRYVQGKPSLRDVFRRTPPEAVLENLRAEETPETQEFLQRLKVFLDRYGYRSVNEAELMLPSWDRDPGFVLSVIRNLLQNRNPEDPEAVEGKRSEERLRTLQEARVRLDPVRRRVFLWVVRQAHTFIAGREKNKALLMMGIHAAKNAYFELARRLQENGALREASDLYFLTRREVARLCLGEMPDPYDRIPARRTAWERNRRVRLPETFRGRPVPLAESEPETPAEDAADDTILSGLGVSPGQITGKARVILDPRTDAYIEEGEILVAPVTDAGWTPLFLVASALVVDVGGLLSHGSIVAREYGIPGVLNVFSATKRIRTGQTLTVDGTLGTVRIHRAGG